MIVPTLRIRDRMPQLLQIVAAGADVARIAPDQPIGTYDEEAIPDVVARWVAAVNLGLLGSAVALPGRCAAELVDSARTPNGEQTWLVRVELADRGAFRVLMNLLAARDLDTLAFTTARQGTEDWDRIALLDAIAVSYPMAPARPGFVVDRFPPARPGKNRGVNVGFGVAPADDVIDGLTAALDLWAELIVWGGYSAKGQDPRHAGALPDGAYLYDPVTVAQTFTEAFDSDEAAFDAVVSLGAAMSSTGAAISRVEIR